MSYFAPYVDESGLHYPTYNDILEDLIDRMQTIYGAGIYLGNDSKDYQMLSMFADKIHDTYQSLEIAYNAHSPLTAIGTGLDYIVALNGITRKQATHSTVVMTLSGTTGTVITDGKVMDDNGHIWDLPETVILDSTGSATVNALCEDLGPIPAPAGTITGIVTPTEGWISAVNSEDAVTGSYVETDSALRGRQGESVAQPSQSIVMGLKSALIAIDNVRRVEIYENSTSTTDEKGIPSHSICCVVDGGDEKEIAEAIHLRKGMGCGTYGTDEVELEIEDGASQTICFTRVKYVDVDITLDITARAGYAASTASEISAAILDYLSAFSIGADLTTSIIWMVAQQVNTDFRSPSFSISSVTAARHGEEQSADDVAIDYDEVARGKAANITINVT